MLTEGVKVSYQKEGSQRGDLVWLVDFANNTTSGRLLTPFSITVNWFATTKSLFSGLAKSTSQTKSPRWLQPNHSR
jgi:hypothetical protein